jgi:hypothetical protein
MEVLTLFSMDRNVALGLCLGTPVTIILCICGLCFIGYKIEKRNTPRVVPVVPVIFVEQRKEPEEDPIPPVEA